MWTPPRELHIRLVVCDGDAVASLELAAAELKQRALQARDRRVEFACVQAHDRILAIAAAYAHLQTLALERPVEMAESLPALCQDLFACLEYPRPALIGGPDANSFPMLTALAADGVIADIMEDSAERGENKQGCTVSLSLERDSAGEWVVATSNGEQAAAEEALGEGGISAWTRQISNWVRERMRVVTEQQESAIPLQPDQPTHSNAT